MMRSVVAYLTILGLALLCNCRAEASEWSNVAGPSAGPSRVIGSAADGCIAGAMPLPPNGVGYRAIHLLRRRYFGHPVTIEFIEAIGRSAKAEGIAAFYVGDLAQPRGGPMSFGHAAHENGLDVDIWFELASKSAVAPADREDPSLSTMLLPDGSGIDPARFGSQQVRLLKLAATDPHVDRIFVHPLIKRALCEGLGPTDGDRGWLHRLRPWYGHDDHFHVRLRCPADSPDCVNTPPLPPGDGCDASLAWWFTPHPPVSATAAKKRQRLPAQCAAIIQ